ncbi:hypothetical protein HYV82_00820 [Candidatus Woesearchaeota archaeon]|nr:hypothetical protein [Candidatus Woesearchaeota archaeon]
MRRMHKSAFVDAFGESPRIKALDFVLDNRLLDWSKSDMARATGMSRNTLNMFFSNLVKSGIIVRSRAIGRAVLYKVNTRSGFVQRLIALDNFLCQDGMPGIVRSGRPKQRVSA